MIIKFDKYQGTGNDFIIINDFENTINLNQSQISSLCERKFGIGSDGLIVIQRSDKYDFKMVFYNPDGNKANMCGNGGRCIARFAYLHNIAKESMVFIADDGLHNAQITGCKKVKLQMKDVDEITEFNDGYWLNTGVPHFVKFINEIDELDIKYEGRKLADDKRFAPERTNVNFVKCSKDAYKIATYERGVEGETLACGTGATATALAIHKKLGIPSPIEIIAKGGLLKVYFEKDNLGFKNVFLEGNSEFVFSGEIKI